MSSQGVLKVPNLDDDQILRVVCGLRPCRRGGLRIELEEIGSIGKTVVHNYGHGGCGVTLGFGTAIAAADLVDPVCDPGERVGVLGAGVVGLSAARELLKRGYKVRIYSALDPMETTSLLAGALWLPTGIEFGGSVERRAWFHRVLGDAHRVFQEIDRERFGVDRYPVYEPAYAPLEQRFFDNGTIDPPVDVGRLPLGGPPRIGRVFHTDFIHTAQFLGAMVEEIIALGGEIVRREFAELDDLRSLDEPVLVNALAMGSRDLFDDDQVYPARGVLVHLKPQDLGYCVHDGYKYMFPRRSCLILGGCFLADDWNDSPDRAIADEILAHHRRFFGLA